MISALFAQAAPIMLASSGALLTELSGTLGVFIEGFMVLGSFFSWVIAGWTGSVFLGSLISAVLAGISGLLLSVFVQKTRANPFIAGLALNLAAAGLTETLSTLWFGTKGVLRNPGLTIPSSLHIPLVSRIPVAGPLLQGHPPFVCCAVLFVVLSGIVLNRTSAGLRLKAAGLAPEAAIDQGIRPSLYRAWTWAFAAFLASLAGAALSFRVGAYSPGGVAGRGWIALAAVYLGFRGVWGTAAAAMVFALAERIGFIAQGINAVPATLLLGLPSALALLLYAVSQALRNRPLDKR
jgi:simple sugar transport system permease protein